MSYQAGWIQEIARAGWTAFKLCWREKDANGQNKVNTKTMPRNINGKETVRKDAEKELNLILQDVNKRQGVAVTAVALMTFKGFVKQYWDDYTDRHKLRDSTKDSYNSMMEQWINPHFEDHIISTINKQTVSEFFGQLRSAHLSDKYQKNIYSLLTKIFDLAVAFDVIVFSPINVTLHRPHVLREEKISLTIEQYRAFLKALPTQAWRVVVQILIMTGMRQGELLGLRWLDINFAADQIVKRNVIYRGKLVKGLKECQGTGEVKTHIIGMGPIMAKLLMYTKENSMFTKPTDFVFTREDGRPLDPDNMRRYIFYPAMDAAEVPRQDHGNGLHLFRHTMITELGKRMGLKAASSQAGHSNINTTANIYTHVDQQQKFDSAVALEEAFGSVEVQNLLTE